jgi:hypothetical protein
MSKTKTIFCSSDISNVSFEMECFANHRNEIYISIYNPDDQQEFAFVCLDKLTAIKLSKHLRSEISILINSEV